MPLICLKACRRLTGLYVRSFTTWFLLIFWCLLCASAYAKSTSTNKHENLILPAYDLSVSEGFIEPIGFYDKQPRFSWKLPLRQNVITQSAYQLKIMTGPDEHHSEIMWDSGKVISNKSAWLEYQGPPLKSRQIVYWTVKYWDQDDRESFFSAPQKIEMGLLNNQDWQAKWIGIEQGQQDQQMTEHGTPLFRPQYLRREFSLTQNVKSARLYISAKGVFKAYLNGRQVGSDVMSPGWTPYQKRIETLTYDVTNLLKDNSINALGIVLAEGWFAGRIGYAKKQWINTEPPSVLAQLEIEFEDSSTKLINTDKLFKASQKGPIRSSSIYDGEYYDASYEFGEWTQAGFDDSSWQAVDYDDVSDEVLLVPKRHLSVKTKQAFIPLSITQPDENLAIFDLGQNIVGVARINVPVKAGQQLRIRFAELLQKDGHLYTESYRSADSTDYFMPAKDGYIEWQPMFTFHGFQFVEISGYDSSKAPDQSWVTGLAQYSDLKEIGHFSSSDVKLNKLQSNIKWGIKGNFFDIPTDCPQRDERLGWTGDAQVIAPTSMFNIDAHAFWSSWLQSVRDEQHADGGIPIVVPDINRHLSPARVSSGWGDAIAIVPWSIYQSTGDKSVLQDNYAAMKHWVDFYQSKATKHIIDLYSFGDWLQPYSSAKPRPKVGDTSLSLIGTAYYARSVYILMQSALVLNNDQDFLYYQRLFNQVRNAFENRFFDDNARTINGAETQTSYLLALGFDLLSHDKREKAKEHLVEKLHDADKHLRTGFLGTPLLTFVLDDIGREDLALELLFNESYPSWFFPINQGATTMWERWNSYSHEDGFGQAGMNSFNHYAYGAIGQWMYERLAGIQILQPGYKKIRFAPLIKGPLSHVRASHESPYGTIEAAWRGNQDTYEYTVSVPPNTTAELILPASTHVSVTRNNQTLKDFKSTIVDENSLTSMLFHLKAGDYSFSVSK